MWQGAHVAAGAGDAIVAGGPGSHGADAVPGLAMVAAGAGVVVVARGAIALTGAELAPAAGAAAVAAGGVAVVALLTRIEGAAATAPGGDDEGVLLAVVGDRDQAVARCAVAVPVGRRGAVAGLEAAVEGRDRLPAVEHAARRIDGADGARDRRAAELKRGAELPDAGPVGHHLRSVDAGLPDEP